MEVEVEVEVKVKVEVEIKVEVEVKVFWWKCLDKSRHSGDVEIMYILLNKR